MPILKKVSIDTYREYVVFLSRHSTAYRPEEFQPVNKMQVGRDGHWVMAVLNIVDDERILGRDQIGLSEQAFRSLGLPEGAEIGLVPASPPKSLEAIRAKIQGSTLTQSEFDSIIGDIASHRYSKMEIAAFLISSASFLTTDEVLSLTRAMAKVGTRLRWPTGMVVDKHSIGGIPGNRTSMIVVPIVAAHGLLIPKTSSRAITSPAGTADTMEVLARVDLSVDEMRDVVEKTRGCLVWGGHVDLSPADDVLISVERPLSVDTREQMVASILSKKLAAGSTHLVIDVPVGPTAKMRHHEDAVRLRKLFEFVGGELGLNLDVAITDGRQPVGRGIGPVLEAREVMKVLRRDADAPRDLREKALFLSGRIIEFDPELRGGKGLERATEILDTGRALEAMERIIEAQGPCGKTYELGSLTKDMAAPDHGVVSSIDCFRIARIARLAGAPLSKGAGIELFKKVGDQVRPGEPLYRIYADHPADFRFATDLADEDLGYTLSPLS